MDTTTSTHSLNSKGTTDNTGLHTGVDASHHSNYTSNRRSHRYRRLWWSLQQLVRNQRSTKWGYNRLQHYLHRTYSWGSISTRDCNQSSRNSRSNRDRQNYHHKLYYYLAVCLLTVMSSEAALSPVRAEDVYNTAAPESNVTGSVTNQAVQFQNNGAPSRQSYGGGVVCNGPTMTLSPFYMGNDTTPMDYEAYVKSNQWGAQLNFMVPLDWSTIDRCKAIAKRQEEKLRLDYELVRALKCAEIQQKGFTFRPGSRVEHLCSDIVPIALVNKTTTGTP